MKPEPTLPQRIEALARELPEVVAAFRTLQGAAAGDGALDARTKRLVMVGIAVSQRCQPCIRTHVGAALELGASRAEILDAAGAAILMGGGPALATTATVVLELLDEAGA